MSQRQILERLLLLMIGFGLVMFMVPFFSDEEQGTEPAYPVMDVDVSRLAPGSAMQLVWVEQPLLVLRRTPAMLEGLRRPTQVLVDPWSKYSQQPDAAKNVYRSVTPEYLVVSAVCNKGTVDYRQPELMGRAYPHGALVCRGNGGVYDLAGRVLDGMPDQNNLEVPAYRFVDDTVIRLGELP
jgi:ubiquinol-cytochrome c reductase iron-sulfur subunit